MLKTSQMIQKYAGSVKTRGKKRKNRSDNKILNLNPNTPITALNGYSLNTLIIRQKLSELIFKKSQVYVMYKISLWICTGKNENFLKYT